MDEFDDKIPGTKRLWYLRLRLSQRSREDGEPSQLT